MNTNSPIDAIKQWYDKSRIDYSERYVQLFIAYAIWFKAVTHKTIDREAIESLKKRFVIWDEYYQGATMKALRPLFENIVKLSNTSLLRTTIRDPSDWQNLIEFWYEVRCRIFHGELVFADERSVLYVKIAYESLSIFMNEIVSRMERTFSRHDEKHLFEIKELLEGTGVRTKAISRTEQQLYAKYINSAEWWNVDMAPRYYID